MLQFKPSFSPRCHNTHVLLSLSLSLSPFSRYPAVTNNQIVYCYNLNPLYPPAVKHRRSAICLSPSVSILSLSCSHKQKKTVYCYNLKLLFPPAVTTHKFCCLSLSLSLYCLPILQSQTIKQFTVTI